VVDGLGAVPASSAPDARRNDIASTGGMGLFITPPFVCREAVVGETHDAFKYAPERTTRYRETVDCHLAVSRVPPTLPLPVGGSLMKIDRAKDRTVLELHGDEAKWLARSLERALFIDTPVEEQAQIAAFATQLLSQLAAEPTSR
jgi:hypothetical protein